MAYRNNTSKTWAETYRALAKCFAQWGVKQWLAEPNVPMQRVNSSFLSVPERAVTVRYTKSGSGGDREVVLTLDTQDSPASNLRAIYLCIEDMRMIDVRGVGNLVASAYMQLAAPAAARDPWEVLGLRPGASSDLVQAAYKTAAKTLHPDAGGSDEAMAELNAARDRALAEARS